MYLMVSNNKFCARKFSLIEGSTKQLIYIRIVINIRIVIIKEKNMNVIPQSSEINFG